MNLDRIWDRFILLLSVEKEKGNIPEAIKHPVKNFFGSIDSHKKVFDKAVAEIAAEENDMSVALMDGDYDVGGEG